jgi:hypothetical protein
VTTARAKFVTESHPDAVNPARGPDRGRRFRPPPQRPRCNRAGVLRGPSVPQSLVDLLSGPSPTCRSAGPTMTPGTAGWERSVATRPIGPALHGSCWAGGAIHPPEISHPGTRPAAADGSERAHGERDRRPGPRPADRRPAAVFRHRPRCGRPTTLRFIPDHHSSSSVPPPASSSASTPPSAPKPGHASGPGAARPGLPAPAVQPGAVAAHPPHRPLGRQRPDLPGEPRAALPVPPRGRASRHALDRRRPRDRNAALPPPLGPAHRPPDVGRPPEPHPRSDPPRDGPRYTPPLAEPLQHHSFRWN